MIWVIGSAVFHDVSQDHRAVALQAENRRVAHLATIAERERIARDVHDIAGQALTAIIVRSQLVQRLAPLDQGRVTEEADKVERIARDALSSMRESVAGWHQASLLDELAVARDALAAAGTELETLGDWRSIWHPRSRTFWRWDFARRSPMFCAMPTLARWRPESTARTGEYH